MLAFFAQRGNGGGADAAAGGMMAVILGVMCVVLAISITIQIFYLLTLSKALQQVRPRNRTMEPGQVWLNLIPFFNLYWIFVTTSKVPESLRAEFRDRGMGRRGEDYGAGVGKWYAICTIVSIIPFVNYIAGPAALILWIMFWVKVAGFKNELATDRGGGGGDYDDEGEDDYDDRPRRKRRRDDDYDDEEDDRR